MLDTTCEAKVNEMRLVPSYMFKPSSIFTDCSKTVLLFMIIFVICVLCVSVILSCLFLASFWSPAGKGLSSWLLYVMFFVFLSLSHMVTWDRCDI